MGKKTAKKKTAKKKATKKKRSRKKGAKTLKVKGFVIDKVSENYSPEQFFSDLGKEEFSEFSFDALPRAVQINMKGDFIYGVLLTESPIQYSVIASKETWKLKVTYPSGNQVHALVNAFVANKHTGNGLMAYYHGSCTIGDFCRILKNRYNASMEVRKKLETDELYESFPDHAIGERNEISRKYKQGQFSVIPYTAPEDIEEMLGKFDRFSRVTFATTEPVQSNIFEPVKNELRLVLHTASFKLDQQRDLKGNKTNSLRTVTGWIKSLAKAKETVQATVHGEQDGRMLSYPIDCEIHKVFERLDFDPEVATIQLDSEFEETELSRRLREICQEHEALFSTPYWDSK